MADPKEKVVPFYEEFKAFALKGNVVDLAVGVIVGTAFAKLIDSLVKNVIMPMVGLILPGDQGYVGWKIVIGQREIPYGQFLGEIVNFLIVSLALFFFTVKFIGWLRRIRGEEKAKVSPLTKDQELLTEIRDLLKASRAPA
jgi:large conductance mechanosensitive channel